MKLLTKYAIYFDDGSTNPWGGITTKEFDTHAEAVAACEFLKKILDDDAAATIEIQKRKMWLD